jgi:hypothetical protein
VHPGDIDLHNLRDLVRVAVGEETEERPDVLR